MLTEAGKKYIAENFGITNCWVFSGLSWTTYYTDGTHDNETGGTGKIVNRLLLPVVYDRVELHSPRTGTYRPADLTAANGGNAVVLNDVRDIIVPNDGYPAGEAQYCKPTGGGGGGAGGGGGGGGGGTYTPPSGETGVFNVCTFPGGATVKVDGLTVPGTTPTCPHLTMSITVAAKVAHTFEFSLAGYETAVYSDPTKTTMGPGGVGQILIKLTAEAGAHVGVLEIRAHDAKTGGSLAGAKPSIDDTSVEDRYVIPCKFRLPVSTSGSKVYKVGASFPGYDDAEQTVTLRESHTWSSPLVVDLALEPVRIWREVRITKELPRDTWITGVSIPSVMAWGVHYTGSVTLRITRNVATDYQAYLELHSRPAGWDGDIATLPGSSATISTEKAEGKTAWDTPKIKLNWGWTCAELPEGVYVAVAVAAHWEG